MEKILLELQQAVWLKVVENIRKMERIDKPMMDAKSANIQFGFDRNTGNDVMHIRNLEVGYQSSLLLLILKLQKETILLLLT